MKASFRIWRILGVGSVDVVRFLVDYDATQNNGYERYTIKIKNMGIIDHEYNNSTSVSWTQRKER